MARSALFIALVLTVMLKTVAHATNIGVMSIDLGSEFMKLALVKPGVPMDIVLNKETKRKTPVAIAFKDGERFFGDAALTKCVWGPEACFTNLNQLLGKKFNHPLVQKYQTSNPHLTLLEDKISGRTAFKLPDGTIYNVEELMAMILRHAKQLVDDFAHMHVYEAVIAMPPYATQAERLSMAQAAQLADLTLLQIINDNTASALNYGVFRRAEITAEKEHTVLLYDMGASGTRATVVSYKLVPDVNSTAAKPKSIPQLTIRGVGYDRTLGSSEMQLRLRRILAERFEAKHKIKLTPKALVKLDKEAKRVKEVLSANNNFVAQVEGIINDIDLREPIDRATFEAACFDLKGRVAAPVESALQQANMKPADLDLFIVIGGGVRTPFVQSTLKETFEITDLAKVLNGDEACALGAVYNAAHLGRGFRVQPFNIHEYNLFPIEIVYDSSSGHHITADTESLSSHARILHRMLFDVGHTYPLRKMLTYPRHYRENFNFSATYNLSSISTAELDFDADPSLFDIKLKNVSQVYEKYKDQLVEEGDTADAVVSTSSGDLKKKPSAVTKGVRANFLMDLNGMFSLSHVDVTFEIKQWVKQKKAVKKSTLDTVKDTLSGIYDSIRGKAENDTVAVDAADSSSSTDSSSSDQTSTDSTTTADGSNTTAAAEEEMEEKLVERQVRELVGFNVTRRDWIDIGKENMKKWQKVLNDLDDADMKKFAQETARNRLEAWLFRAQERVDDAKYDEFSSKAERETLRENLQAAATWLEEETAFQEVSVYDKKLESLKKTFDKMDFRIVEAESRPTALKDLDEILNNSRILLSSWQAKPEIADMLNTPWYAGKFNASRANATAANKTNDAPLASFTKLLDEVHAWRNRRVEKQAKLQQHEDPVLTSGDIADKLKSLTREVKYLLNKIKYAASKTATTTTAKPDTDDQQEPPPVDDDDEKSSKETAEDDESPAPEQHNPEEL